MATHENCKVSTIVINLPAKRISMNKTAVLLLAAIIGLGACKAKKQAITQSRIDAKVDSLVAIKMEEINMQAMEDLDRRMAIEVKAKADSIVQAVMAADTSSATK